MRFANRALSVGGLLLVCIGLTACGSGGSLLSRGQASELRNQLAQVSQSLNAHQCQQAANLITNFQGTVDGLSSVDQNLVANLNQGASHLSQVAARQCPVQTVHHRPTHTNTQTTPTTTTQTATTPTTPTQTSTTPTTPTQTSTTPTTTTGPGTGGVPLPGNNGNGNGNGGGGGN